MSREERCRGTPSSFWPLPLNAATIWPFWPLAGSDNTTQKLSVNKQCDIGCYAARGCLKWHTVVERGDKTYFDFLTFLGIFDYTNIEYLSFSLF